MKLIKFSTNNKNPQMSGKNWTSDIIKQQLNNQRYLNMFKMEWKGSLLLLFCLIAHSIASSSIQIHLDQISPINSFINYNSRYIQIGGLNPERTGKLCLWNYTICFIAICSYRKISIDRPGGIHFLSTHNFWTTCHRTTIRAYSDRKISTLKNIFLSLFFYVWFRSYMSIRSGYPLVYLSRFYGTIIIWIIEWVTARSFIILCIIK